jgi:hypothetical protein
VVQGVFGDPEYFGLGVLRADQWELRGGRIKGGAEVAGRLAGSAVAAHAIVQVEFSAGDYGFVGGRQRAL